MFAAYYRPMWPKPNGPRRDRPASGAAAGGPATLPGPALTTLRASATRIASIIRCVGIVCTAAQVIIWHSYYLVDRWRLTGPAIAVAWGIVATARVLRRWPAQRFAVADSAGYLLLALCACWFLPPVLRGDTANWLYMMLVGQLVALAWFTQGRVFAALALASVAAYWTGAALAPAAGSGPASPATACALLLAIASAAWFGRRMLFRRAIAADTALARADREAHEQYVLLSRHTDRRENERLLHDTVLNTLTALARGGGGTDDVVRRCGEDVGLIEAALAGPDDAAAAACPDGGLLVMIEEVAGQMRARGLAVHVAAGGDAAAPGGPAFGVHPAAARALAHAVREALANVAIHAGTSEAWIDIGRDAAGAVLVTVRDSGAGFHPARVVPGRLGLRRSIIERVADHGGQALVRSAPGEGTEVSLRWAPPRGPSAGAGLPAGVLAHGGDGPPW